MLTFSYSTGKDNFLLTKPYLEQNQKKALWREGG